MSNIKIKMAKLGSELKPRVRIMNESAIVMPNKELSPIDKSEEPSELRVDITAAPAPEVDNVVIPPSIASDQPAETTPAAVTDVIYNPLQALIDTVNEMESKTALKDWLASREIAGEFDMRMSFDALKEKVIQYLTDQETAKEAE